MRSDKIENTDDDYYSSFIKTEYSKKNRKTMVNSVIFIKFEEFKKKYPEKDYPREAILKVVTKSKTNISEAQLMKECNSIEGVVKFYHFLVINSKLHIFMQFCKQGSLADLITRKDPEISNEKKLIKGFHSLLLTLSKLHEANIFHRDIKPDNIFVNEGQFLFGDLGESKFCEEKRDEHTLKGTVIYLSPRLYKHYASNLRAANIDPKKEDVWSLGKTFLETALKQLRINFNGKNFYYCQEYTLKRLKHANFSNEFILTVCKMMLNTEDTLYDTFDFEKMFYNLEINKKIDKKEQVFREDGSELETKVIMHRENVEELEELANFKSNFSDTSNIELSMHNPEKNNVLSPIKSISSNPQSKFSNLEEVPKLSNLNMNKKKQKHDSRPIPNEKPSFTERMMITLSKDHGNNSLNFEKKKCGKCGELTNEIILRCRHVFHLNCLDYILLKQLENSRKYYEIHCIVCLLPIEVWKPCYKKLSSIRANEHLTEMLKCEFLSKYKN